MSNIGICHYKVGDTDGVSEPDMAGVEVSNPEEQEEKVMENN